MAHDRYERLRASAPVNRTAGIVTGRGHPVAPGRPIPPDRAHWTAPPNDCRPKPGMLPDLVGARLGRFTVISYRHSRKHPQDNKLAGVRSLWIVRCSCGDYEERTTEAILAAKEDPAAYVDQMCWNCEQLVVIQRRSQGIGEWPEDRKERILAASGGEAAMAPAELHEIKNEMGWSWSTLAWKANRSLPRIKKMASGSEPVDQSLADWLREQRYRKSAGLTENGVPIKRP